MAEIVLGLGSSHAPQLALTPAGWWRRAEGDKLNTEEFWFKGKPHTFEELADARAAEHLDHEIEPDLAERRYQACQSAVGVLADKLAAVRPDVCIIVGDDQAECFLEDNMPAVSVYWGESVDTAGAGERRLSGVPGRDEASQISAPKERLTHPCDPELGRHLIDALIASEIDVAHSRRLPAGRHGRHSIGHAFTFVYRRLMQDEVIPHVPIFLNTYFPPNQPTMQRCYEIGHALRSAIEAWDSQKTVALVASGGLSHKVVEEELDQQVLDAFRTGDEGSISRLPMDRFQSGTSEIRNWAVVAGAMRDANREMQLVDYVPCYRSAAGTGVGMSFAIWQ